MSATVVAQLSLSIANCVELVIVSVGAVGFGSKILVLAGSCLPLLINHIARYVLPAVSGRRGLANEKFGKAMYRLQRKAY